MAEVAMLKIKDGLKKRRKAKAWKYREILYGNKIKARCWMFFGRNEQPCKLNIAD